MSNPGREVTTFGRAYNSTPGKARTPPPFEVRERIEAARMRPRVKARWKAAGCKPLDGDEEETP